MTVLRNLPGRRREGDNSPFWCKDRSEAAGCARPVPGRLKGIFTAGIQDDDLCVGLGPIEQINNLIEREGRVFRLVFTASPLFSHYLLNEARICEAVC
jgi:hypothetical protein